MHNKRIQIHTFISFRRKLLELQLICPIDLSHRHANYSRGEKQRSLLPYVFEVFGFVCGGNSNSNENSAKSGISKDVHFPPLPTARRPTSSRCTNGCFGKMNISPMREGLKSWSAKRKSCHLESIRTRLHMALNAKDILCRYIVRK